MMSAISGAKIELSGVASGLVNTSYLIGSALVLAIVVSVSTFHSETLIKFGINSLEALNNGFHLGFIGAAIISTILIRTKTQ